MKNLKSLIIAAALLLPAALALAQVPYNSGAAGSISAGVTIAGTNGTTETLPSTTDTLAGLGTSQTFTGADGFSGGITTQSQVFSSVPSKNPLVMTTFSSQPIASANAIQTIISGVAGRTVYVNNAAMMVGGGNAATCTGIKMICQGSNNLLGTVLIASLTSAVPVGVYSSGWVLGEAFVSGCNPGDGVALSAYGAACATATFATGMVSYTVQ